MAIPVNVLSSRRDRDIQFRAANAGGAGWPHLRAGFGRREVRSCRTFPLPSFSRWRKLAPSTSSHQSPPLKPSGDRLSEKIRQINHQVRDRVPTVPTAPTSFSRSADRSKPDTLYSLGSQSRRSLGNGCALHHRIHPPPGRTRDPPTLPPHAQVGPPPPPGGGAVDRLKAASKSTLPVSIWYLACACRASRAVAPALRD